MGIKPKFKSTYKVGQVYRTRNIDSRESETYIVVNTNKPEGQVTVLILSPTKRYDHWFPDWSEADELILE